jgi:ectoine hydroxylase-related dioxygenase (phytanoyl-CoA dioxygenase family)
MNAHQLHSNLKNDGWVIFEGILDPDLTKELRADCLKWVNICTQYQIKNKINHSGDGTAHHSIGGNDSIDRFIAMHKFHDILNDFFDGQPYILHACNPVSGAPGQNIYVHKIHRDVATFIPNYKFRINMLVMLDDFTLENGATQVLPRSHTNPTPPDLASFEANHLSILGKAGSVVLFNSYLWHRGGRNVTDSNRVALTLSFGRAYVKPQMDYARLLGEEYGENLSELTRQVLGYKSRVPVNLDEWYQPKSSRLYHADQG